MLEHTDGEKRGKHILGMPVYSLQEGKRLGEVTALLLRRADSSVAAVRVGGALNQGPPIPYAHLRLVGADAVFVESEAVMGEPLPPEAVRELDDAVTGRAVITARGARVGTISGLWVQKETGRVAVYRVRPDAGLLARLTRLMHNDTLEIPVEQVQALGADALIVSDAVTAAPDEGASAPDEPTLA